MQKYEVRRDFITKYNNEFGTDNGLEFDMFDMSNFGGNGADKPATGISWNEAARFVNWLNTSTGGYAAYNFTTGGVNDNISFWTPSDTEDYDPDNPFRSKRANYALPSRDEWHKAVFFDSGSLGTTHEYSYGTFGQYHYFSVQPGDTPPIQTSGSTDYGTAVYGGTTIGSPPPLSGPADVDNAGGLQDYGTMGMAGNAAEWNEGPSAQYFNGTYDLPINSPTQTRDLRGGWWNQTGIGNQNFTVNARGNFDQVPTFDMGPCTGFGVVGGLNSSSGGGTLPEPSSFTIMLTGACLLGFRRSRR